TADFGLFAAKRLIRYAAVDKGPGIIFLAEDGGFVVLHRLIVTGIGRDKFDRPFRVALFPVGDLEYFKSLPSGLLGPLARARAIKIAPLAGMDGPFDKIDVGHSVSRIARPHQCFSRRSGNRAFND